MSSVDGEITYYEERIAQMQDKVDRLYQKKIEEQSFRDTRFGSDSEYPIDCVILYKMVYNDQIEYTFTAVKTADNQYYHSGRNSYPTDFKGLLRRLHSATEVWFVTQLERM